MKLMHRDIELFRWINGFGCVFTGQVAQWMGVSYQTANSRIFKLKQAGYLKSVYRFVNLPHLLLLTRDGWNLTGDSLPPKTSLKKMQTFNHDIRLVDLSLLLSRRIRNSHFVPERRLLYNRARNDDSHCPDGLLYLPEVKKPVAIELELTQKKRSRLEQILNQYSASLCYDRVWYFTSEAVTGSLKRAIGDDPLFCVSQIRYTPCL